MKTVSYLLMSLIHFLLISVAFANDGSSCGFPNITFFDGKTGHLTGPEKEVAELMAFPLERYKIYTVNGLGSFYIDNTQDTIKGTLSRGEIWEHAIVQLIKKYAKKGTVAVDLGSHIGTHLLSMAQAVGDEGYVLGIEPQKKMFSELRMNMLLNRCQNVGVYRCAVGRDYGRVQMNPAYQWNEGGTAIGSGGDFAELIPLDSLKLHHVSLMKIDVEGYEDEVLAGATETISRDRPTIIIELMDGSPMLEQKRQATIKTLEKLGYAVSKIHGWDWIAVPKQ